MKKKDAINAIHKKAAAYKKLMERSLQMIEYMPIGERFLMEIKGRDYPKRVVGEIIHYCSESIRFEILACNIKARSYFNMWNKNNPNYMQIKDDGKFTERFKNIVTYAPWKNEESPLLVNFEYIKDSFKNELFN